MATVKIGDRELAVLSPETPGGLGRLEKTLLAEAAVQAARVEPLTYPRKMAELVMTYVGHNEGMTVDWLLTVLPVSCGEIVTACVLASQGKTSAPGEAASQ